MSYNSNGNFIQRNNTVVMNLIIINVLVFLATSVLTQYNLEAMGSLYYYKSPYFKPYQFLTSMFMHANFGHIFMNMFVLWMFGTMLERYWGPKKFLIFYLICGIGAGIFQQFFAHFEAVQAVKNLIPDSPAISPDLMEQAANDFMNTVPSLGASGAIMGLLAGFVYLFPNTELYLFFIPIPVKAKYIIPVYVLIDLFGGLYHIKGDNIGHFTHLGGALIGFLLVLLWSRNRKTFY